MTWPVLPLSEVVTSVRNGLFARRPNDEGRGTPILRISAVRGGRVDVAESRFVEGVTDAQLAKFLLKPGDLLMTRYNGSRHLVGIAGLVPELSGPFLYPDKLIRLVVDRTKIESRFLWLQLQSPAVRAFLGPRIRTTAGQSGISGGDVRSIPLVVPEIGEQRRVVGILEDHLSSLDAGDTELQTASSRVSALQRASLDRLFGQDLATTLGDLVLDISAGKSFGSANAPACEDEWGIIKVSAMTWGAFDASQNKAVPAELVDPRYEIRPGDLLVSRANTSEYVGASVLVGQVRAQLLLSDKSLRITPKPGVDSEWLWRALQAPSSRRQISSRATGTKDSMRNISQSALRAIRLPSASSEAQAAALREFAEVEVARTRLAQDISAQQGRSRSLRRAVLAAAFEGELTGRHTDSEVIEELAYA